MKNIMSLVVPVIMLFCLILTINRKNRIIELQDIVSKNKDTIIHLLIDQSHRKDTVIMNLKNDN